MTAGCSFSLAGLFIFSMFGRASGEAFLGRSGGQQDFDAELQAAMASVMGCQDPAAPDGRIDAVRLALLPMWQTLPTNRWGRVDWAMVRYASHRYFMQQYGFLVRGFEPNRLVNSSALGTAEVLSGEAHPIVDTLLKEKVDGTGFSLDDVAFMLAALERVVHDGERVRLEQAYRAVGRSPSEVLARKPIVTIVETYILIWMLGDLPQLKDKLVANPSVRSRHIPFWKDVRGFVDGVVRRLEFESLRTPQPGSGRTAMQGTYSFEGVHRAIGYVTSSFASLMRDDCLRTKASLVAMDKLGTGRVAISDFYGAYVDGLPRFAESEAYLREMGVLDETSAMRGVQLIIPNYVQAASNCFATNPHYMVCCMNECEEVLNYIHAAVGAPMATADLILGLVQQMSNFDDEALAIDGVLKTQLRRIEQAHGGNIPLHGRLFAQWLHFVFPRECPMPHKPGTAHSVSHGAYGAGATVTKQDARTQIARHNLTSAKVSQVEQEQWMSLWSDSMELDADFNLGLAPWERAGAGAWVSYGCCAMAVLGTFWSLFAAAMQGLKAPGQEPLRSMQKQWV